jgi:hypothetical protein
LSSIQFSLKTFSAELKFRKIVSPGVLREVLEDLWHDLSAVVGVLEEVEEGDVDPEEVAVVAVQVVRTLSSAYQLFFYRYHGHRNIYVVYLHKKIVATESKKTWKKCNNINIIINLLIN